MSPWPWIGLLVLVALLALAVKHAEIRSRERIAAAERVITAAERPCEEAEA